MSNWSKEGGEGGIRPKENEGRQIRGWRAAVNYWRGERGGGQVEDSGIFSASSSCLKGRVNTRGTVHWPSQSSGDGNSHACGCQGEKSYMKTGSFIPNAEDRRGRQEN